MSRFNRSFLCHAALTVVHIAACVILVLESAFADALCAFAAAAIYGVLTDGHRPGQHPESATPHDNAPNSTGSDAVSS